MLRHHHRPLLRSLVGSFITPVLARNGTIQLCSAQLQCSPFYASARLLAKITMKVPGMGDSITEGTVREWKKQVGEAVQVDEVVAVLDTDKVSVDIRATEAGVLVEQLAAADDAVTVGADLLVIDTTASASASPATASAPAPAPAKTTAAAPTPAPTASTSAPRKRVPLIKFLGKRSLLKPGAKPRPSASPKTPDHFIPTRYEDIRHTPGVKSIVDMPKMYGRPKISMEEMEAIESGGAL